MRSKASAAKSTTKNLLLEVGEDLLGRHGFDGISVREVAKRAGQANNAAVNYHFKNKAGLIRAILEDRVHRIETLRRDMLDQLRAKDRKDLREVLKILWLPTMAITGTNGSHTFCRFLLQYMLHPGMVQHPVAEFGRIPKTKPGQPVPNVTAALDLALTQCRHLTEAVLYRRLSILSMMFLSAVVEYDNVRQAKGRPRKSTFDIEPVLDIAVAALSSR
jgi:AcrR family transcriptional regulator